MTPVKRAGVSPAAGMGPDPPESPLASTFSAAARSCARSVPVWANALVLAAVISGIVLRIVVLTTTRLGSLDADEATWGLMARHILHGELPIFFWRQGYGGTAETFLTAGVFGVFGSGAVGLRLVPIALWAAAAVLVWRVGRRTVGEPAARLAAGLFWVWPAYGIWKSTRAHGYYSFLLVSALAVLLFALRVAERPTRRDAAGLGFALGVGWWTSPQVMLMALPVLAWLLLRRRPPLRSDLIAAFVASLVLGAGPWLIWNARHHGTSIGVLLSGDSGTDAYKFRLHTFFDTTLPMTLGLRAPFSLAWIPDRAIAVALFAAALGGFAWLVARRREGVGVLVAICLFSPFMYSASSFTWFTLEPRYLVILMPVAALLCAREFARRPALAAACVAGILALSVLGLRSAAGSPWLTPLVSHQRLPPRWGPLLNELRREDVRTGYADYWIAYPIMFLTRERMIFSASHLSSDGLERRPAYEQVVERDPCHAYVFVAGDTEDDVRLKRRLATLGYRSHEAGGFLVYTSPAPRCHPG